MKNSRETLETLLQERIEYPERAATIDGQIWSIFGCVCAIMVLDMSGFSRLSLQYGVIHFLAMIQRMNLLVREITPLHGGRIIKFEADNAFVLFDTVEQALAVAQDINLSFNAVNTVLPVESDMLASFGIGYGETLEIADGDIYGSEVNLASKLGEDIAGCREILLTECAYQQIAESPAYQPQLSVVTVGALTLNAYKL